MVENHHNNHIILILFYHYLKIAFVKEFFPHLKNVTKNLSFQHLYLFLALLTIFKMNQLEIVLQVFDQVLNLHKIILYKDHNQLS